jgi:predicted RNA-binding protein
MRYWLTLTDQENWEIIKKHRIYAINSDNKINLLKIGDKLVMYLIPKQISGIFSISKLNTEIKVKFKNKDYKYYFELEPLLIINKPLLVCNKRSRGPIVEQVSIFKNAKRWGTVLMGTPIIEITEDDYLFIQKQIKDNNTGA